MYTKLSSSLRTGWAAALVLAFAAFAGSALADPPDRVARLSYLRGSVSFQPAGDDQWAEASLNRPLSTGDKVYTDRDGRAELEIGSADIRLDQSSTFNLLNLDDNTAQLELTGGVMNLHVRRADGQNYEIDTPTLAFVINQPGDYRIDIAPQGDSTMISVFDGAGDVYGENNASYSVRAGSSYRFNDSALQDYETLDLPRADDFDQWATSRNARYEHSASSSYVSEDVIGYADLDDNGSWNDEPEYGHVWYPTTVASDWAPYRTGHWSWIDPWGWSWVDNASWGFAPFHYGRWAYIGNRWGWCPGRRGSVAIYAPAMVAFVGGGGWGTSVSIGIGGGGPVGWFPLGPRDVYVPWYRASRGYFNNVNVHNTTVINTTNITNVYNNYSQGRPINANYAYRANAAALTAVPRAAFVGARPVAAARVQVSADRLRAAQVVSRVGIAPTQASFAAGSRARAAAPAAAALNRKVIARTAPPARPVPIAARMQAIQRNNAQPLQREQLNKLAAARPAAPAASRVQVVGRGRGAAAAKPQPLPARTGVANRANPAATRANPAANRATPAAGARPAPITPAQRNAAERNTPAKPAVNAAGNAARGAPNAAREALPSSRFAPRGNAARTAAPNRANPAPQRGAARTPAAERAAPKAQPNARAAQPARGMPSERFAPRNTPAPSRATERQSPAQSRTAPQPQRREAAPARENPRAAAQMQQRNAPAPARRETPRSAPQPQPRAEQPRNRPQPAQRSAPQPRYEPRSAPQPRNAPQPRAAPQPQQRQAPAQRAQPQPQDRKRRDDKKDKDDGG
jgi:hypothetical protein